MKRLHRSMEYLPMILSANAACMRLAVWKVRNSMIQTIIDDLTSLPRRVQPIRHILSRERRHREMKKREDRFQAFVEAEMKKVGRKK